MKRKYLITGVLVILCVIVIFTLKKENEKLQMNGVEWQMEDENTVCCEYNCITYYFDKTTFEKENACNYLRKIDIVLEHMDELYQVERKKINIYIGCKDVVKKNDTVEVKKKLDFDEIWNIAKNTHGSVIKSAEQYGELYRYCLEKKIIKQNETKTDTLKNYFEKEENVLFIDFTLPMIESVYFTEEQAEMTKEAVKAFANWYVEAYSQKELEYICRYTDSMDMKTLTDHKNEWLNSLGSKAVYKEFGKICFQYNDYQGFYTNYLYKENTAYATYKIESEDAVWLWDDEDVIQFGYKDMIEKYMEIEPRRCFDFAEARNYLQNYLPENLEKVKICTSFIKSEPPEPCEYISGANTIVIRYGWLDAAHSLLHEYIHYLTVGKGKIMEKDSFLDEWFPTLLETFELENQEFRIYLEDIDQYSVENIKEIRDLYWDAQKENYSYALGRMRYTLQQHYIGENERAGKETGYDSYNISVSDLAYAQRAVMAKYLVDQYGFDKFVEMTGVDGNFRAVFGKTFKELYFDMIDWLKPQMEDDEWLRQKLEEEGYNLQI